MNLRLAQRRTMYLLTTVGFLALFITEQVSLPFLAAIVATLVLTYGNEDRVKPLGLSTWFWNALTVVFFLYEGAQVLFGRRDLILNVTEFLIVLQLVRLWARKSDRDTLQIYGLSLLHLIAASVLTASLYFSIIFFFYIIAGTWALVVFNFQREMAVQKRADLSQDYRLTAGFFGTLSFVAVGVFLCSIVLFLFFPRLNYNYFAGLLKSPTPKAGFTEAVKLGQIGSIKTDQRPVMRVTLSGPLAKKISPAELYLTGVVLAHYDGDGWSMAPENRQMMVTQSNDFVHIRSGKVEDANLIEEVLIEPRGHDVLFGISEILGFRTPFGVISHRSGENFMGTFSEGKRIKYTVYSRIETPSARVLRAEGMPKFDAEMDPYLQVPADLDPRIEALARQVTARSLTLYDRASALEVYLRAKYGYTLDMKDPGDEQPVAYFLFTRKAGHCEYFASAYALMLRTLGIPTRLVNGYYHGHYNRTGRYTLFRESDAHTWVEVYFPEAGWRRFDPTPADPTLDAPESIAERFAEIFDSAQALWVSWIVEYNLQDQRGAAQRVWISGKGANQKRKDVAAEIRAHLKTGFTEIERPLLGAVIICLVAGGGVLVFQLLSRRRPGAKRAARVRFYEDTLRLLQKHGFVRQSAQTPLEFAQVTARKVSPSGSAALLEITELFYRLRYGAAAAGDAAEVRARRLLAQLRLSLR